jgi:hypothetical protein
VVVWGLRVAGEGWGRVLGGDVCGGERRCVHCAGERGVKRVVVVGGNGWEWWKWVVVE